MNDTGRCEGHPVALVQPHESMIKNALGFGRCGVCGAEVDLTRRSTDTGTEQEGQ